MVELQRLDSSFACERGNQTYLWPLQYRIIKFQSVIPSDFYLGVGLIINIQGL